MTDFSCGEIAGSIDHALHSPTLTWDQLEEGCQLAVRYGVASVCTMPFHLPRCVQLLAGSGVQPSTTIGFPHGVQATSTKRAEAEQAIADGCQELDMVVNLSKVLSGDWQYVRTDIQAVIALAHDAARRVKVIFENCYLGENEKIRLCEICGELDADWIKTSTGFGAGGAELEDVRLMRRHTPPQVQIKAAGGIRDLDTLLEFRSLGVTRIGVSQTAAILNDCRIRHKVEGRG